MKYKKIKLATIFFIFVILLNIILFSNKVEAVAFSVSASKSSVTVGDTFSVTIDGTGLTGRYSITSSNNISLSGDTSPWIENNSTTITCTANGEGTGTITVTPVTVADSITGEDQNLSAKTVSITIKSQNSSPATTPETPAKKSSEARLRNLGITPNDFKGFKKDITTYNVEVPNNVSKVNVYATALNPKATISGTGNVTLNVGLNTVNVVVTAEDGTKKTYTLNITRLEEETTDVTSEARLSNLGIRPEEYDFSGFKRDTTSYTVEVPNDIEEIEVYAEAVSSKATIKGTGTISLKEGLNTINVEVTAEDGTTKTYTLEITRKEAKVAEEINEEELGLSTLVIKNVNLSPKFDPKTYAYTIDLTEDISSLEIESKANNSNATIEIVGNENLKDGENIITILITNAETEEYATYQIVVNKNVVQDEITGKVDWLKPSTWGIKEKIVIGIAIALIMVIIVAIVLKIKLSRNQEDEDFDLPGAEELDKALAEHQELADDADQYQPQNEETATKEQDESTKSDIEKAQEYFESYSKRRGKHF